MKKIATEMSCNDFWGLNDEAVFKLDQYSCVSQELRQININRWCASFP